MADIFISYKRDERAQVERLATALRGLGYSVWFDASLSAGESFSDEIDREVRGAAVVVVCWSAGAAASDWVKAEAQIGFSKKKLISVFVEGPEGFEPPVPYNSLQVEDLRGWIAAPSQRTPSWRSVLRRLGQLTGRADVAEWGALGADATAAQVQAWFLEHGKTSPLVLEAESHLRELESAARERQAAEEAARERFARLQAEKDAAEAAEATERAKREAAEAAEIAQRQTAERAEHAKEEAQAATAKAERKNKGGRRLFIVGGLLAAGAAGVAGFAAYPMRNNWFPSAQLTPEGKALGLVIRPSLRIPLVYAFYSMLFTPDGARLVGGGGGNPELRDAKTGKPIVRFDNDDGGSASCIAINGERVAAGYIKYSGSEKSGGYAVWDLSGKRQIVSSAKITGVSSVGFAPDGGRLVTGCDDKTVRVWDLASGAQILLLQHENNIDEAMFSPDGATIATLAGGSLNFWDAATGQAKTSAAATFATRARYFDGGQRIITSSASGAGIWDIARAAEVATTSGDPGSYFAGLAVREDARYFATGHGDGRIALWDGVTGARLADLWGHGQRVEGLAFSPDGERLAGSSYDDTVLFWDITNG